MSVCVHVCPFLSKNQQKKNNSVLLNPPGWLVYPYCNVYSPLSCVMLAFWRSLGYKTSLLTIPPTSCPDVNLASLCRLSGLTGHSRCTLPCSAGTFIVFGNNNMSNDTRYSQPFRQTDKKKTGWVWEESGRKHVTLKLTLFCACFSHLRGHPNKNTFFWGNNKLQRNLCEVCDKSFIIQYAQ